MKECLNTVNKFALQFSISAIPKIKEICNPLQQYLGIGCFGYLRIYNDCRYIFLINGYETYSIKRFDNIKSLDPHFLQALKSTTRKDPHFLLWQTNFIYMPPIMSLLYEHNIWNGFDIIWRDEEYSEMFYFAFDRNTEDKTQFYFKNSQTLVKFCNFFRIKAASLLDDKDKNKFGLYHERFDFSCIEDINKKNFLTQIDTNIVLKDIHHNLVYLTKRESECLKILVKNKTIKAIAQSLYLSPRTVECYLNNIKQKLKVNYKNELIDAFNNTYY